MSRHLMEPDPDADAVSLADALWVVAFVLLVIIVISHL